MRIMNNLIVGLNGGVNRVTSARVVEGIGAYSNPFRPAPFSTVSCHARKRRRSDRLVSGTKDHGPSCTEGRERPFNFITKAVISSILIILIPVWAGFGLPGWTAWLCTVAFLAGLRQANRDYDLLVSPSTTRYKSKTVSKANASCVEVVADTANSVTGSHAVTKDKRRAEKFSSYNSLLSPFSPGASLSVSHKNRGIGNGALL